MKLTMDLGARSYHIIIKRGSLKNAGALGNLHRKVMVVSDSGVPKTRVNALLKQCAEGYSFVLPRGEASKSVESWQALQSALLANGFGRDDAIAALGGGMVGDVAGFAAASYLRGIEWMQFPTTTLAQLDACIGGRVSLNLDHTKNVLGALHQPGLVVVDPDALKTLTPRQYASGLAEALKIGLVGSSEVFSLLETLEPDELDAGLERLIYLCLRYVKGVVERDEAGVGERRLLGFGHTIGQGIEAAGLARSASDALLHGECVALGMLPMLESRTLERRVKAVMRKYGLPLKQPYPAEEVLRYIGRDQRRHGNSYKVVRVKTPGRGYVEDIDSEELRLMVEG